MRFKDKYPIAVSLIATVIMMAMMYLVPKIPFFSATVTGAFAFEIVMMIIPVLILLIFGDISKVHHRGFFKTLFVGGYLFFIEFMAFCATLFNYVDDEKTAWLPPIWIIYGVVELLGVGVREEVLFRGLVVGQIAKKYAKDRCGVLITATVSAVIFGSVHMMNVFYGVRMGSAIVQSLAAMGIGFYLAAVYLRGGSLTALILIHSLTDAVSLFSACFTYAQSSTDVINEMTAMNVAPLFTFGLLGLFLLRKKKCDEICEKYAKNEIECLENASL